ncbi:MAG: hypothetical protein A2Y00_00275 [Omnitrophica WOR_2 bacterium GWF2_43_52]|nr:MAG: hypothetical protein A2062_00465 [Omnitrophica WOR_2 bacterium GWA2_44_7]OGX13951.1 MAG: hypothetical protein A2Y01_07900 [Omnitrophica WOR_2 bacterium GWC2_44_8]OGX20902.1 MAG: hypothetical protein A2Y00_00275 [Omnitrophica WOR_2 bacterium GWF2_43_52]OGX57066.1 MAG: hypothetical protein A2460_08990 [Omnitrophica WOR_2 bacterium RIFOXYC2_FULL_43_9]HAH21076.1 hypothetical protein [Candidatus Omnitrophota bacterium]
MVFYSPDKKYRAYGKLVGLAIGVCLLQVSVVPSLWGLPIAPDFLLLSTLIMAMRMPVFSEMIVFSLLCGLLKDFFSVSFFGMSTLGFACNGAMMYGVFRYVYKDRKWVQFLAVAAVTVWNYGVLSIMYKKPFIFIGCIEAILNCLFLPLVGALYHRLELPCAKHTPFHAYR